MIHYCWENNQVSGSINGNALLSLVKICIISSLTLLVMLSVILYLAIDSTPSVTLKPELRSETIRSAADLLQRTSASLKADPDTVNLYVTQNEFNNIFTLLNKKEKKIALKRTYADGKSHFNSTVRLPFGTPSLYINSSATLLPSQTGLLWDDIKLGDITIPNGLFQHLQKLVLALFIGKSYSEQILNNISHVTMNAQRIGLTYTPSFSYEEGIAQFTKRMSRSTGITMPTDDTKIAHYYELVVNSTATRTHMKLGELLTVVLAEANNQTKKANTSAVEENSAALLALSVYLTPNYFKRLVTLPSNTAPAHKTRITLDTRTDLAKHFTLSAAIKLIADNSVSYEIGELKEIFDSRSGGSGFSFVDLAADRSGILFSTLATESDARAKAVQTLSVSGPIKDSDFFPNRALLEEGLTELDFIDKYQSTDSEHYVKLVTAIDKSIQTTHFFKQINRVN